MSSKHSILFGLVWLLSACTLGVSIEAPTPVVVTPTVAAPVAAALPAVTLEASAVARSVTTQIVEAVPPTAEGPWWEPMPQYTLLTLQGYPISGHSHEPQVFVYPVGGLAVNETARQVPSNLWTLLQSQQAGQVLPYLPLSNAAQVMHAQVQYLDFKNGQGVRYLTQFDQAANPINNHELLYTYQGLTSDSQYYVAVVLPVNLAGLPLYETETANLPQEFTSDFPTYLVNTVKLLDQSPASAYAPDLSQLDALVQSLEVK